MNKAAVHVLQKGHPPIIGVNMALPIIAAIGEENYNEIMMPVSMALAERCDAVLRIGGRISERGQGGGTVPREGAASVLVCSRGAYSVLTGGPGMLKFRPSHVLM